MDTSKAKKKQVNTQEKEREYIKITSALVENSRVVSGAKGDIVFFTLILNGVKIYNCRVATGKDGDFISFPQYKGTNGQYYNNVYASISKNDSDDILAVVQAQIDQEGQDDN